MLAAVLIRCDCCCSYLSVYVLPVVLSTGIVTLYFSVYVHAVVPIFPILLAVVLFCICNACCTFPPVCLQLYFYVYVLAVVLSRPPVCLILYLSVYVLVVIYFSLLMPIVLPFCQLVLAISLFCLLVISVSHFCLLLLAVKLFRLWACCCAFPSQNKDQCLVPLISILHLGMFKCSFIEIYFFMEYPASRKIIYFQFVERSVILLINNGMHTCFHLAKLTLKHLQLRALRTNKISIPFRT